MRGTKWTRKTLRALVKELRDKTGAGMMDCKTALTETKGNLEEAVDWLRKKGLSAAAKKAGRIASEGTVASYIHAGGKVGVLATPSTFQGELYASVVERFAQGVAVLQDTCPGLVAQIEAGAVDFITKPINLDEFIKVVRAVEDFWLTIVKLPGKV